jgi:hypothetical protein
MGIVNLFPFIDDFSPLRELFRAISIKEWGKIARKRVSPPHIEREISSS